DLHLGLRNEVASWQRRALTNELAWFRVCHDQVWTQEEKARLETALGGASSEASFLDHVQGLCAAANVPRFCDSLSLRELMRFADAVDGSCTIAGVELVDAEAPLEATSDSDPLVDQVARVLMWT